MTLCLPSKDTFLPSYFDNKIKIEKNSENKLKNLKNIRKKFNNYVT